MSIIQFQSTWGYLTVSSTIISLLLLMIAVKRRYFAPISSIPGPFVSSFSILWQIWSIMHGDFNWRMIHLHKKYGYFVRISHEEVSVSHPDAVRQLLLAPMRKGPWYKITALPNDTFEAPMAELDPKRKVEMSRQVGSAYSLSNVVKSEPYIDDVISLLCDRLAEAGHDNKPVELDRWFGFMAFDIIGEVTFSRSFGFLRTGTDIGGSIANARVLMAYISVAGFFQRVHKMTLGNPYLYSWGLMPHQHIFDTTLDAIKAHEKNPDTRNDMLSMWASQHEKHPERMSRSLLYGVTYATVGAGSDAISAFLQAFYYHALRHPQHIARLRHEIDDAKTTGKVVTWEEARQLPFLQASVKETLRMHTPNPFGLPRVVPEGGLTVGGRHFKAGTILCVNPWVIHRSREIFGDDADEFNPDRWLGPNGKSLETFFIPFGVGYNSCPGRNLAILEGSKTIATLVRDFDIQKVNPDQEWVCKAYFLAVPRGWSCYIKRRRDTMHTRDFQTL